MLSSRYWGVCVEVDGRKEVVLLSSGVDTAPPSKALICDEVVKGGGDLDHAGLRHIRLDRCCNSTLTFSDPPRMKSARIDWKRAKYESRGSHALPVGCSILRAFQSIFPGIDDDIIENLLGALRDHLQMFRCRRSGFSSIVRVELKQSARSAARSRSMMSGQTILMPMWTLEAAAPYRAKQRELSHETTPHLQNRSSVDR